MRYALLDTTALDASGITRLQNQPVLALKGEGFWWASLIPASITRTPVQVFGRQQQNPADLGSDDTGWNAAGGNPVRCRVPQRGD